MKKIYLTGIRAKGKYSLVDDDDYEVLNNLRWWLDSRGYAIRWSTGDRKNRHHVYMHRLIKNTPSDLEVDHIDGDRLNNQKNNLRNVTHLENTRNNHKAIGVCWNNNRKRWRAYIGINGRNIELGYFINKTDAILSREQGKKTLWAYNLTT